MLTVTDIGGNYLLSALFKGGALPSQLQLILCKPAVAFSASDNTMLTASGEPFLATTDSPVAGDGSLTLGPIASASYSPVTITTNTGTVLVSGGVPTITWAQTTFTFSTGLDGDSTVHGYQLAIPGVSGPVLFEGLFAVPYKPPPAGGTLKITPQVRFGNGTPT